MSEPCNPIIQIPTTTEGEKSKATPAISPTNNNVALSGCGSPASDQHQAKEIAFFANKMGDKTDMKPTRDIEAYDLDDANSFEDEEEGHTDQDEDRADQEFESEIDGREDKNQDVTGNSCHEGEDSEASQQFSIDDVTDDEEGDEEDRADISSEEVEVHEQNETVTEPKTDIDADEKKKDATAKTLQQQQASTGYDSQATNQCSSSSDVASKKTSGVVVACIETQAVHKANVIGEQAMNIVPSRTSLKKEPQLDRENFVEENIKKFLAHVETREIQSNQGLDPGSVGLRKSFRRKKTGEKLEEEEAQSQSSHSKSSESEPNKDNEDPNNVVVEKADAFDPKELKELFEGWSLYKKTRISFAPVRRYQYMIDQDYKKNKVTVCAHLQNIFNSSNVKRGKYPTINNYFDIEKWLTRMGQAKKDVKEQGSPSKEIKRIHTLAAPYNHPDEALERKDNFLLAKSNSTAHVPESSRTKNVRRVYGNFDKDLAVKMFGYRVIFSKKKMSIQAPDPKISQGHKPLQRFVQDIIGELNQMYQPIHRYHTKQRVLIPLPESDEEEFLNNNSSPIPPDCRSSQTSAHGNHKKSQSTESQVPPQGAQGSADVKKKLNGELVVLKTRTGEKQTFLKKTRNLLWHCNSPERIQSATSNSKRNSYVKNTSAYGHQSFNHGGSPVRNAGSSPKKLSGTQNQTSKYSHQPNFITIKNMNMVRYAQPRAGVSHPPNQHPSTSLRFSQNGSGNQNCNNYRRQNSYRKAQQRVRVESAKGARGIRQSLDNHQNPAFRLINQHPAQRSSSDQNFVMNGQVSSQNDSEVAKITSLDQKQSNNVVYLKDPKHIQGFGSNVVHVNVSCGQSVPDNKPANPTATASNNSNAAKPGVQGKGTSTGAPASTAAQAAVPQDEDEDAQTFIIQLSEEQTRQLASGSLKLNGVPIPKDLGNLNYEQIMALLDSVNFPQKKNSNAKKTPVQSKATPLCYRDQGQHFRSTDAQRRAQGAQKNTIHSSSSVHHEGTAGKKQNKSSLQSTKTAQFMGTTNMNDVKSLTYHQINNLNHHNNQQQYATQGKNLLMQTDNQGFRSTGKPVRTGINGRENGQQQYTSAPQKIQRVDSASRNQGNNCIQQQPMSFSSSTKNEDIQQRQQRMRIQKGRSLAPGTQTSATQQQQFNVTRNSGPQNASIVAQSSTIGGGMTGPIAGVPVNPGAMGNQEWNMLTMLQQQQQQLKNAQQFLQHSNLNLEHSRKFQEQGMGSQASNRFTPGQETMAMRSMIQGNSGQQMTKSAVSQEGCRGNPSNNYSYMMPKNGQSSFSDVNKPVAANSLVRNSGAAANQGTSEQMIIQQQQQQQQRTLGSPGFSYVRTVQGVQQSHKKGNSQALQQNEQQRSMTRLNSKRRLNQSRKTATKTIRNNEMQLSSSKAFIKAPHEEGSARTSHHSAPANQKQSKQPPLQQQQPNLLFPTGKVNQNLLAHEKKLITNHQQQSQGSNHNLVKKNGSVHGQHQKRSQFNESVSGFTGVTATPSKNTMKVVPNSIKALSTKNQLSKTSIELEYSKFENNSTYLNVVNEAKMHSAAKKSGANQQYYHTRIQEEVSGAMPVQKLRINQQALNNNLSYQKLQLDAQAHQPSHSIKQSAMNAIQGQSNGTSLQPTNSIGNGSYFFHIDQKSHSQPYNKLQNQSYHQGTSHNRKSSNQGGQPQFIMRNPQQVKNSSAEPLIIKSANSATNPTTATKHGTIKSQKVVAAPQVAASYPFIDKGPMRGPGAAAQQQPLQAVGLIKSNDR